MAGAFCFSSSRGLLPQREAKPPFVQLQAQQQPPAVPLEQHRSGQHGLEAQGDVAGHLGVHQGTLQQQVASAFKGEGGGGLTEGSSVPRRAGAGVSVSPIQQEGRAGALVLAFMSLTALQPLVTVYTPILEAVMTLFGAVANVAANMALTPASILAGTGVTLVYHLLAEGSCQHKKTITSRDSNPLKYLSFHRECRWPSLISAHW